MIDISQVPLPFPCPSPSLRLRAGCTSNDDNTCGFSAKCLAMEDVGADSDVIEIRQLAQAATALHRIRWHELIDPSTIQLILREGRVRIVRRSDVLFRQNAAFKDVALILSGAIESSVMTFTGRKQVVAYCGSGDILNLFACFDGKRNAYDHVARTDTKVILLSRNTVKSGWVADARFRDLLVRMLCGMGRKAHQLLPNHSLLSLRKRCLLVLLQLTDKFGVESARGIAIGLKLSQEEVADIVGCSRPKINSEMKELERIGLIEVLYKCIHIVDYQRLRALAVSD